MCSATVVPDFFRALAEFAEAVREMAPHLAPVGRLAYGGEEPQRRTSVHVIPWHRIQDVEWG